MITKDRHTLCQVIDSETDPRFPTVISALPCALSVWQNILVLQNLLVLPAAVPSPRVLLRGPLVTRVEGTVQGWKVPEAVMRRYLRRVAAEYCDNAYHNAVHAADVTQAVAVMLRHGPGTALAPLERLSLVLAAAVHDLGHGGVTNEFLVATRHPWAVTYNDVSVNENRHVSRAIALAEEVGVAAAMSAADWQQVRHRAFVCFVHTHRCCVPWRLLRRSASPPPCLPPTGSCCATWHAPSVRLHPCCWQRQWHPHVVRSRGNGGSTHLLWFRIVFGF